MLVGKGLSLLSITILTVLLTIPHKNSETAVLLNWRRSAQMEQEN